MSKVNKQNKKIFMELAKQYGYSYSKKYNVVYGQAYGYNFTIMGKVDDNEGEEAEKLFRIIIGCKGERGTAILKEYLQLDNLVSSICDLAEDMNLLLLRWRTGTVEEEVNALAEILKRTTYALAMYGYTTGDFVGYEGPTFVCYYRNMFVHCTNEAYEKLNAVYLERKSQLEKKVLSGLAGAVIGQIIGALLVFVVLRLGVIAKIVSVVMGYAIVKGYSLKKTPFTKASVFYCNILAVIGSYIAFKTSMIMDIMDGTGWNVRMSLKYGNEMLEKVNLLDNYYHDLLMLVLMAIISTTVIAKKKMKEDEGMVAGRIIKID
ncbi:MAG: hypothetical protein K6G26_00200 [Lachnospiraceae bacterium]|nr:hypothetical protein [Lachnospiraceae bacterium]